jgi:hypothetical protein
MKGCTSTIKGTCNFKTMADRKTRAGRIMRVHKPAMIAIGGAKVGSPLSAPASCHWGAFSSTDNPDVDSWLQVDSQSSLNGNGTVGFHVLPNTGLPRQAFITIRGSSGVPLYATFTVTEDGLPAFGVSGRVVDRTGAGIAGVKEGLALTPSCSRACLCHPLLCCRRPCLSLCAPFL